VQVFDAVLLAGLSVELHQTDLRSTTGLCWKKLSSSPFPACILVTIETKSNRRLLFQRRLRTRLPIGREY